MGSCKEELPRGQGETILLVEDEPTVLEAITALLEYLGYQILPASSGEEALWIYEHHREVIALVLTDIMLPEMGGLELCRILHYQSPTLPIVVLSGEPILLPEQRPEGVVEWLQKPVASEQLAQVLRQILPK